MKPHRKRLITALGVCALAVAAMTAPPVEPTEATWTDEQHVGTDSSVKSGELDAPQEGQCSYKNGLLGLTLQSVTVTWLDSGIGGVGYEVGFVENGVLIPVAGADPSFNGSEWEILYQEGLLSGLLTGLFGKTVDMFVQPKLHEWRGTPMVAELHMTGLLGSATKCVIVTS